MNKLILLTLILAAVIFLFVYVNSHASSFFHASFSSAHTVSSSSPRVSPTSSNSSDTIVPITIKDDKRIEGPSTLHVGQNEMVILKITSDTDDELEIPGYNKYVFLEKGKMVVLSFLATLTGNFSYQLKNAKAIIGTLTVK